MGITPSLYSTSACSDKEAVRKKKRGGILIKFLRQVWCRHKIIIKFVVIAATLATFFFIIFFFVPKHFLAVLPQIPPKSTVIQCHRTVELFLEQTF